MILRRLSRNVEDPRSFFSQQRSLFCGVYLLLLALITIFLSLQREELIHGALMPPISVVRAQAQMTFLLQPWLIIVLSSTKKLCWAGGGGQYSILASLHGYAKSDGKPLTNGLYAAWVLQFSPGRVSGPSGINNAPPTPLKNSASCRQSLLSRSADISLD